MNSSKQEAASNTSIIINPAHDCHHDETQGEEKGYGEARQPCDHGQEEESDCYHGEQENDRDLSGGVVNDWVDDHGACDQGYCTHHDGENQND